MQQYGDNFIPVIPTLDPIIHTPDRPFCYDPTCPDKEDQALIGELANAYQDGLVSADDAGLIHQGKTV
jgi:hypothetical protein